MQYLVIHCPHFAIVANVMNYDAKLIRRLDALFFVLLQLSTSIT